MEVPDKVDSRQLKVETKKDEVKNIPLFVPQDHSRRKGRAKNKDARARPPG
jgi:hypothetical protein